MNSSAPLNPPEILPVVRFPIERSMFLYITLMMILSAIVLKEPAPCDLLYMGFMILVPVTGYGRYHPLLLFFSALWCIILAGSFFAAGLPGNTTKTIIHVFITMYLAGFAVTLASFISYNPDKAMRIIMNGFTIGALIAAVCGIAGYFNLFPNAETLFTKYGRASGTFKDPNVFGPYVAMAALYVFARLLRTRLLSSLPKITISLILLFTLLISFSRGAWLSFIIASSIYGFVTLIASQNNKLRLKLILFIFAGLGVMALLIILALQNTEVATTWQDRVTLSHDYDTSAEGRFAGQLKALSIILEKPFGIGSLLFGKEYHHELPHNNYISMFLNGGWVAGVSFLILTLATIICGIPALFKRYSWSDVYIVCYGMFVGISLESLFIDTEHWRLLYLLFGMVWGGTIAHLLAKRNETMDNIHYAQQVTKHIARSQQNHQDDDWQDDLWLTDK